MGYDELLDRLAEEPDGRRVTALPDGSVDAFYAVYGPDGDRIGTRDAFGEFVADDDLTTLPIEHVGDEPGGQAVNMAIQADALGDRVTLFGHLDDSAFDDLGFDAVSMGDPTRVVVYPFDDEDLMLSEDSEDVADWTIDELRTASDAWRDHLAADAVCWGNWVSVDRPAEALAAVADEPIDGGTFVIDPGPITVRDPETVKTTFGALAGLVDSYEEVVVSVNREELAYAADALSVDADEPAGMLDGLRAEIGVGAAVLHAAPKAAAATASGEFAVPNLEVDEPVRRTGAGDRFGAALASALARGWGVETALALGNCCASFSVATGRAGDRGELREYLREHL